MVLYRNLKIHHVFGANTDVGKTVFSTLLTLGSIVANRNTFYLKPVSTGPLAEADDRHIARYLPNNPSSYVSSKCLYQFQDPISPHLAVKNASQVPPSDDNIVQRIRHHIQQCARSLFQRPAPSHLANMFIETAGGVHSPTPAGTSQAEAYRPLRLPTLLVGDSRLGGISSTIAAYESLYIRGYTIDRILLFHDAQHKNHEYLAGHFAPLGIGVTVVPHPPSRVEVNVRQDEQALRQWYTEIAGGTSIQDLLVGLDETHQKRYKELEDLPQRTLDTIWYPFVQHKNLQLKDITVIDSAYGDAFAVYSPFSPAESALSPPSPSVPASPCPTTATSDLVPYFDGTASWWTQGIGHGHSALTLTAANAAGRYGHVISTETATAPSTELAERMLATHGIGAGWASRVFISDNGSTGMEVAIKMALRGVTVRYGTLGDLPGDLGVLGIAGSYHGDTIGAMDMCEAGTFNSGVEWYKGRGFWFDAPCVGIKDGVVSVESSTWMRTETTKFRTLSEAYDVSARLSTELANTYATRIREKLRTLCVEEGRRYGALVMEPLLLGAGGMMFVDPLFQRVLIDVVRSSEELLFHGVSPITIAPPSLQQRWHGLPLIYDQVFTGLGRLGSFPSLVLGANPDIAVYAKLLSGGLVPLSATLATADIFEAFLDAETSKALLHGHTYAAYPVGCAVANKSLELLEDAMQGNEWRDAKKMWAQDGTRTSLSTSTPTFAPKFRNSGVGTKTKAESGADPRVWSLWSPSFVDKLSQFPWINKVCAMGTVLAFEVTPYALGHHSTGYSSDAARTIFAGLGERERELVEGAGEGGGSFDGVHFRPLGDVGYLMTSFNTPAGTLRALERRVLDCCLSARHST